MQDIWTLRKDADTIVAAAIQAVLPDAAVQRVLSQIKFGSGRAVLVAVGKAAWQMAKSAADCLGERIDRGLVVTKYGHSMGPIPSCSIIEAGHPIPDENSILGAEAALELVDPLGAEDTVIFLLSGGGSALFELPLIPLDELEDITQQLLFCGADIVEINMLRKRLSAVKGGRFAQRCAPAQVYSIILSDIIGDPVDMIASGPACPDSSTTDQVQQIVKKYDLKLSVQAHALLSRETPKQFGHVKTWVTGNVRELCRAAADACLKLGYEPVYLTDQLCGQAREAGRFLASIARSHAGDGRSLAFILGGETVVQVTGTGKGGRNQELALAAAPGIRGLYNTAIFSVGSDGTDGPTDAAGGYVDGRTAQQLDQNKIDPVEALKDNNAYYALEKAGGLIITGPTGTNVNDVSVVLIHS